MARETPATVRSGNARSHMILFEAWPWFDVSSAVFEAGLAREMTGADFKRYVTLRYLANFGRSNVVQVSLRKLEQLDGISPRRAHEVNPHLQEMGMVEIERDANPYKYRLYEPSQWRLRRPCVRGSASFTVPTLAGGIAWR